MNRKEAFQAQAASDHDVYEHLSTRNFSGPTFPGCHRLHYLQMWLEKLCKAYLTNDEDVARLEKSHKVVMEVLPRLILKNPASRTGSWQPKVEDLQSLCREIDRLHPAIDRDHTPENVEYPWNDKGVWKVPAREHFSLTKRLYSEDGKKLLKAAVYLTEKSKPS